MELKKITESDFERYFEILNNKKIPKEAGLPRFSDELTKQIHFNAVLKNQYSYGVFENSKLVGVITLSPNMPEDGSFELGYFLDEHFWNQHIMTRAIKQFIEMILNDNPTIVMITANTWSDNAASKRVLENCGFQFEGQIEETSSYDFLPHKVDQFKLSLAEKR